MKASYAWLRALAPTLTASPRELADRLTHAGLEVEGLTEYGAGTQAAVVAQVRKVEPHPTRPRLRLVTVDRGGGSEQRVVCGAANVPDPGGLVVLATVGTELPAIGVTLAAREIGGITSEGMICSERELGLVTGGKKEDDMDIIVLPHGLAAPGTGLPRALPAVHDWIFEINAGANRPDALGHVGIARDLAAIYRIPFAPPPPDAPARVAAGAISNHIQIFIEDTERCPHYGAAMVEGVVIGPSPAWLRYRLESLGIRAISNVVDITNLILLEFGHPMHAFDLDRVRGGRIVVRRAAEGESLATLDGVSRTLHPDDLVIADAEGAVALGGIMGGAGSEIGPHTKRVLLECAYFAPRGIRRSSRRHGLHTESSHRFERGADPGDIPDVLAHAASLLTSLAGGAAVPGSILAGVAPQPRTPIVLRERRMTDLLGVAVPLEEATAILTRLGCSIRPIHGEPGGPSVMTVPPTHRPDLTMEADLIDEVIRIRGLDTIPATLPAIEPSPPRSTGVLEGSVRRAAVGVGLSEAVTYGFVSPRELAALRLPPAPLTLLNPLTEERSVMRTSLLPGLLEALRRARRHGVSDIRLFTIGVRFLADPVAPADGSPAFPDEVPSFAAVLAGHRHAVLGKPEEIDIYDAKGVAVEIVERVLRRTASVAHQPAERRAPYLHPRGAADVLVGSEIAGSFGLLHPDVEEALDLGGPCVVVEVCLRALDRIGVAMPHFRPIPALPAASRDIALVVHEDHTAGEVGDAIRRAASDLCESVELFDLFRGGSVPADHRSLAFHVVYRDPKAATDPEAARTLTDEEVDRRHQAVIQEVQSRFGAVLRA